jgi:Flp pilus assembly protein TadG
VELRAVSGSTIETNAVSRPLRQRLRKGRISGSAALEFAFIAPVFFLMLFALMEIGIIFFAQSTLQRATNDVARLVRTGQVQNGAMTQSQIHDRVCADITPLIPCDSNLRIDVESFSNFGGEGFSAPVNSSGNFNADNAYSPGASCDVVLVRVYYAWTVFTPVLTPFLTNMSGSKHLLYAADSFRNEPFTSGVSGC